MRQNKRESASFRDPSGFLFWREGVLYRQINLSYQDDYTSLMKWDYIKTWLTMAF